MLKLRQERNVERSETANDFYAFHNGLYDKVAQYYDEDNYESYWERNFEHNLNTGSFLEGLAYQSGQIREMVVDREYEAAPHDFSYNLIREAHMRREINKAIDEGFKPEDIVIIVGAYHVLGINHELPPMRDSELKNITIST